MPYIDPQSRKWINGEDRPPLDVGELTYVLTVDVLDYLGEAPSFSDLAEALAALEATKLELYRRSFAPYEDFKARVNGDLPYPRRNVGRNTEDYTNPHRVDL